MAIMTVFCLLLAAFPSVDAAQTLLLPYEEGFEGGQLDPTWAVVVSPGNSLGVNDGWLKFEADEAGLAHIQRPLGLDSVTVSAKIAWCSSIYIVWDADNWCGVGKVSPTPFGRFYSTVTTDDETVELDHRGCFVGSPHFVRAQIGRDCVRFQYSNDGQEWFLLRALDRPVELSGAPTIVAFGKHYGEGQQPLADISPEPPDGPKYAGWVDDIRVDNTPQEAWAMTAEEREYMARQAESDPVGQELLAGTDDPTYDDVIEYYCEMRYPREVVGVPEHPLDIGINHLGQLDVSPWEAPYAWIEVGEPSVAFCDLSSSPLRRRLLEGYLPVLTLSTERNGVRYQQTVFGWSEGLSPDRDLFAYVCMKMRAEPGASLPQRVTLVSARSGKRIHWSLIGASGSVALCFRFKYPEADTPVLVSQTDYQARLAETVEHWRGRLAQGERFEIPDPRVNEAYRAWLVYSLLNADRVNGQCEVHDGAGFYEMIYGNSMASHAMVLDLYGLKEYVEECLDTQLSFQLPWGLYVQECGLPDHGSLMLALAKHYRLTKDRQWLQRVSEKLVLACRWVMAQRDLAPQQGVTRGLIKFRPYNDYPQPVFNYLGNAYCCTGLGMAAEGLQDIGAGIGSEAIRFASEARIYRRDILASMEAAAFHDVELTILPMEPDTHRLLKLSKYRGGDYYGLVASSLFEPGLLVADDPQSLWITEMLEKRKGLIAGLCEFMEGIDHAYTYGYLMTQMERDEIRKVLLGFWSMFAFGMTRETYSPVEVTQIATGENHLTLPHTYSCTVQLRLLRNMLLREEGRVLWLGQAIPRAWLEPGKEIAVRAAPSYFGQVSYTISVNPDGSMSIHLEPPTREPAGEIRIRLRHPTHAGIAKVTSSPSVAVAFSGETLTLGELTDPVDIQVRFTQPRSYWEIF